MTLTEFVNNYIVPVFITTAGTGLLLSALAEIRRR